MKADMRTMKRAGNFTADQRRALAKAYAYLESLEAVRNIFIVAFLTFIEFK